MGTDVLFVEPPAVGLKNREGNLLHELRRAHPKYTLLLLASRVRAQIEDAVVSIFDMKMEGEEEVEYGEVTYGDELLKKVRIGAKFEEAEEQLRNTKILCISAKFAQESNLIADFMQYAKSVNPQLLIVLGGGEASLREEFYLENGADVIINGDGDTALPDLVEEYLKTEQATSPQNGKKRNPLDLPTTPAFDLVDINQYNESMGEIPEHIRERGAMMYFEGTRGCPMSCSFCQNSALSRPFSRMSVEHIKSTLDYYWDAGVRTILFCEENVLLRSVTEKGREEVIEIFTYMKEKGFAWEFSVGIQFGRLVKIDRNIDQELLEAVFHSGEETGCFRALLPFEYASDAKIKADRKLRSFDQELEIVRAIAEQGCSRLHIGFMIGDTDESEESLEELEGKCLRIKAALEGTNARAHFSIFSRLPLYGTPDWERLQGNLAYDLTQDPELWTVATSVIDGENFKAHELTARRRELSIRLNGAVEETQHSKTGLIPC
jgi:hypothetical protein